MHPHGISGFTRESNVFGHRQSDAPLGVSTKLIDAEYAVARHFLRTQMEGSTPAEDGKWTLKTLLTTFHKTLEAMPSVMVAFKSALTFGASTATCENSFSALKNVFTDHQRSMLHRRKAHLIQLGFEKDLTKKCRDEWKDHLLSRFHSTGKRRLQLY